MRLECGNPKGVSFLAQRGATRDIFFRKGDMDGMTTPGECGRTAKTSQAVSGASMDVVTCQAQELIIGDLHSHVVDYGATLKMSDHLERSMGYGEDVEQSQCAILSVSACIERRDQGKKRRPPCAQSVTYASHGLREAELRQEQEADQWNKNPSPQMPVGIRSISHKALRPNHCRAMGTLRLFILDCAYLKSEIGVDGVDMEWINDGDLHRSRR